MEHSGTAGAPPAEDAIPVGRHAPADGDRPAARVIALAWPGPTALVLVLIVGVWAIIGGLVEFFAAFRSGETAGTRAMLILGGLVTIAFGVVLCARPGIGAITLALLFGLFNLITGTWALVQGIQLRRTGNTPHSTPKTTITHAA